MLTFVKVFSNICCFPLLLGQVIQFGASDPTGLHLLNSINLRAVQGENAFNPFALNHFPYGKRLIKTVSLAGSHVSLEALGSLCPAFTDDDVDLNRVSNVKVRNIVLEIIFLYVLDKLLHSVHLKNYESQRHFANKPCVTGLVIITCERELITVIQRKDGDQNRASRNR